MSIVLPSIDITIPYNTGESIDDYAADYIYNNYASYLNSYVFDEPTTKVILKFLKTQIVKVFGWQKPYQHFNNIYIIKNISVSLTIRIQ